MNRYVKLKPKLIVPAIEGKNIIAPIIIMSKLMTFPLISDDIFSISERKIPFLEMK
jgi:hypothetical protein